jgi:hypothetical protein
MDELTAAENVELPALLAGDAGRRHGARGDTGARRRPPSGGRDPAGRDGLTAYLTNMCWSNLGEASRTRVTVDM